MLLTSTKGIGITLITTLIIATVMVPEEIGLIMHKAKKRTGRI